jgi:molybdate/tungstate transport system permease protein
MRGCSLIKWIAKNKMISTFIILGIAIFLFVVVPPVKMMGTASPRALIDALFDTEVGNAIRLSLYAALIATGVGFVFGVPFAYFLARYDFRGKHIMEAFIDIPIVIPHTAAGIALLFIFGRNFFGGKVFSLAGIEFVDTTAGIIVAMLFVSVPFLINSAKNGFKEVDIRLEHVARTLGASPWQTFRKVSLPLAWRSIFSGSIMMWARGISEFGAVVIIAYHPMVAPTLIFERFETRGLIYSQPVAVLLVLISLSIFISVRAFIRRKS